MESLDLLIIKAQHHQHLLEFYETWTTFQRKISSVAVLSFLRSHLLSHPDTASIAVVEHRVAYTEGYE